MKKRQRFLALFTGIGLTLTMSGCGSKKEKKAVPSPIIVDETIAPSPSENIEAVPSPEIVDETATPSPSENTEIVDFELTPEQKEAEFEEIRKKLEADGKYSIALGYRKLKIDELKYDSNPDYESFRRIINLFNINTINIRYCYGTLDINSLIGDKNISINIISPINNSEENNLRIAEKVKNSPVRVDYGIFTLSDVEDSGIEILNAVGYKNGSFYLQAEDSKLVCDFFDKIDSSCEFDYITLTIFNSTSKSMDLSKINAKRLFMTSDCNFSEVTISPTVSTFYISDNVRVEDSEGNVLTNPAEDKIRVITSSDSKLESCIVSLKYNSTLLDAPKDVKLSYYVADYEIAESILNSDYIYQDEGYILIFEDGSDIDIKDSTITYTNHSLDIEETYSTSEFNMDDIRSSIASHQESLGETQNRVKK